MSPDPSVFQQQLAAASTRIQHGHDELAAGADEKACAIAEEVARRGRGGARELAGEMGVSEKTISQAVARARTTPNRNRGLPADTLERLLARELRGLPQSLSARQWSILNWILTTTVIDVSWIDQPGELLAQEVTDAREEFTDLDEDIELEQEIIDLTAACRSWSRVQALAVIAACQQGTVPTGPPEPQA